MKRYRMRLWALVLNMMGGLLVLPQKTWSIASKSHPGPVTLDDGSGAVGVNGWWVYPSGQRLRMIAGGVSGDTFLAQVEEGLDTTVAVARQRVEFPSDVMQKLADRQTLEEGTGISWREFIAENLTAQNYGETDTIDNPQQIDSTILTADPQLVAIQTFIGRRVQARLNPKAFATLGSLAQNAIERLKNTDGHALFASATTTLGATGTTATHGHILAGARRIRVDATEPGQEPISAVLHGYTIHDIQTEVLGGVGTYPVPAGLTQEVFMRGWKGSLGDVGIWEDGLILVDATPDTRGGIFSSGIGGAVVLVQGISPWKEMKDRPEKGYGGADVFLKNEYVWVERSAGNWLYGHLANGTAPTG